jgi:hypothetical protein
MTRVPITEDEEYPPADPLAFLCNKASQPNLR